MALIIFSECDNRYATFGSKIMWHSIAISGNLRLNVFKTSELLDYMLIKNEEAWASTRNHFYPWYFKEHFIKESILNVGEVERKGIGYLRVITELKITDIPKVKKKIKRKKKKNKVIIKKIKVKSNLLKVGTCFKVDDKENIKMQLVKIENNVYYFDMYLGKLFVITLPFHTPDIRRAKNKLEKLIVKCPKYVKSIIFK
jgi:hypothetical protein